MYTYEVRTTFDAAHHLPGYKGKCALLHGHTWTVVATFGYDESDLDEVGMAVDFGDLDDAVRRIVGVLDHTLLNDIVELPTAEMIAKWIYERLANELWPVATVTVYESPNHGVTYRPMEEFDG